MILTHDSLVALTQGEAPMITGVPIEFVKSESIDIPVGPMIHRTKAATSPNSGESVQNILDTFSFYDFKVREEGSVLERNGSYIIPTPVRLALHKDFMASCSAKSSSAREALSAQIICDGHNGYDEVPHGYNGQLYVEAIPLCFNTPNTPGIDLVQMRIKTDTDHLSREKLIVSHCKHGIIRDAFGKPTPSNMVDTSSNGIYFHVDLKRPVVGFESKGHPIEEVFMNRKGSLRWEDFWRRITARDCKDGQLILEENKYYLLTSIERVVIPDDICGELTIYEPGSGDFRSQYARFFDRNFGREAEGTHIVLEVRSRDANRRICHGQRICNMMFEEADSKSESYGEIMSSNYVTSQPCLAKHYADYDKAWLE